MAESIGSLAVYLTGNSEQFERVMDNAESRVSNFTGSMAKMSAVGVAALSALSVKSVMSFSVSEDSINDLNAALYSSGGNIEKYTKKFQQFAATMESKTIFDDEQIINIISYGKNLGIATDKLEEAATAAAGLAAKYKIDLQSAMMLIARASQGQTQMLSRYGIVLSDTLTKEEKFSELMKIGVANFSLSEAKTNTLSGAFQQMKNYVGDLYESIGQLISGGLNLQSGFKIITDRVKSVIEYINKLDDPTKTMIARVGVLLSGILSLVGALKLLHEAVITGAITGFAAMATNLGSTIATMSLMTGATKLAVTATMAQIAITTQLTAALSIVKAFAIGTVAISGFIALGAAVAAVAGAVGYLIGKLEFIQRWTGAKALSEWIYGVSEAEKKGAELDAKLKKFTEDKAAGKLMPKSRTGSSAELLKAEKEMEKIISDREFKLLSIDEKITALREKQNKLAVEYLKTQDEIQRVEIRKKDVSIEFEIQDLQQQRKNSINELQKQYDEKTEKFKLSEMSSEEKIYELAMRRQEIEGKRAVTQEDELKKKLAILDIEEEISSIKNQRNDNLQRLQTQYDEKTEKLRTSQLTAEQRINELLEKRSALESYRAVTQEDELKRKIAVLSVDEELASLQKNNKDSKAQSTRFAAAVEKGTVEAYRAELGGSQQTVEKNTGDTAKNTYQMLTEQRNSLTVLTKLAENIGVA